MMVSFVLSFFPRDVLDEILKLIESVSEDFPSYSYLIHSDTPELSSSKRIPLGCCYSPRHEFGWSEFQYGEGTVFHHFDTYFGKNLVFICKLSKLSLRVIVSLDKWRF